jgi:3-deoxy-D-manno-octulosonate 8-phosphate phosphatase (KDO 8-P phosphatase)
MIAVEILEKAKKIRLVIFDVDGVLTDGCLHLGPQGEEHKIFHIHDGLGIKLLQQTGVKVGIITSRRSQVVEQRMAYLGIQYVYQGIADKQPVFNELINQLKLDVTEVAYVGDDLPDLPLIRRAGLGIAVANARPIVKQHAAWHTQTCGGQGAAREVCELIMQAQGTLEPALQNYL